MSRLLRKLNPSLSSVHEESSPNVAVTVIGTNLVMDYGTEEAAREAMDSMARASAPLDVGRLGTAMHNIGVTLCDNGGPGSSLDDVAAEYARLSPIGGTEVTPRGGFSCCHRHPQTPQLADAEVIPAALAVERARRAFEAHDEEHRGVGGLHPESCDDWIAAEYARLSSSERSEK